MNKTVNPVTDDAELAKVLEDMNNSMNAAATGMVSPAASAPTADASSDAPSYSSVAAGGVPVDTVPATTLNEPAMATETPSAAPNLNFEATTNDIPNITLSPLSGPMSGDPGDLESIKKDALTELRPLVDKLSLPADEKFDTLLLIIRSTDDRSLVPDVYEAAKNIEDDTKRAQALLDVIKEIDFFSKG